MLPSRLLLPITLKMTGSDTMRTYRQLLASGEELLRKAEIEDYHFDAFQLMLFLTKNNYSDWLLICEQKVDDETEKNYIQLIGRRINREPLQYIIGSWSFYESEFFVGEGVLIPRPETEELVELCVEYINNNKCPVVYDLCTGSGCIGLSIARKFPDVQVYLFDLYEGALSYASKNVEASGLNNVELVKCDITEAVPADIPYPHMIVSNPPYIRTDEIADLQTEVLNEPVSALDGGNDGLIFYRSIRSLWIERLAEGGFVAVECGEGQPWDIEKIFGDLCKCEIHRDAFGTDRFVTGVKLSGG